MNDNPLVRIVYSGVAFVMVLLGLYVGYPLLDQLFTALTNFDPILKAIMWIGFILIAIIGLIVLPIYRAMANDSA